MATGQEILSNKLVEPTRSDFDTQRDRALQNTRRNDTVKGLKVGIRDVDEAILYYFNNVIKPIVSQNGTAFDVPIMYASPEKWVAAQKQGEYRDRAGKRQIPIILFKRDSLSRNKNMPIKLDANRPHNFMVQSTRYSSKNYYNRFDVLRGRVPETEYFMTTVPDYVTLDYSCIILTDFIEQTNRLVEAINYANNSYWGDPEKFKFHANIDSFKTDTVINQGEDRTIKTSFGMKLNGYIVPEAINTKPYVDKVVRNITHNKVTLEEKIIEEIP